MPSRVSQGAPLLSHMVLLASIQSRKPQARVWQKQPTVFSGKRIKETETKT